MDLAGKSVLVVCGGYRFYGAEAATLSLIKVLRLAGARVECFTSEWSDGQFAAAVAAAGIPVRTAKFGWFYLRHPWWTMATFARLPAAYWQFRAAMRDLCPDYVLHASYRSIAYFWGLLHGNNILCVHDKISADRQGSWILPRVDAKVLRYLPVSEFIANDLRSLRLPADKIRVLHNCTEMPAGADLRATDDVTRIAIVGQVSEKKGHVTLLLALGELRRRGKRFWLSIFGTGSDDFVDELRRFSRRLNISDAMEFCGYVGNKTAIYSSLDLVIVPSLIDEAFGLAALEPAAYGIPVIASAKGGLPEVVENEKTGFLFPAGDWVRLADLIERIIDSPREAIELGANGRRRAAKMFSERAALDRLRAL